MSNGRFSNPDPDAAIVALRERVRQELTAPVNLRAAAHWNEILADKIRNQHRERRGLDPLVKRWDRNAPEQVVTITEVAA